MFCAKMYSKMSMLHQNSLKLILWIARFVVYKQNWAFKSIVNDCPCLVDVIYGQFFNSVFPLPCLVQNLIFCKFEFLTAKAEFFIMVNIGTKEPQKQHLSPPTVFNINKSQELWYLPYKPKTRLYVNYSIFCEQNYKIKIEA